MKIKIVLTKDFEKNKKELIAKNKLLIKDYDDFEKQLIANPKSGDIMPGTSGVRKIRLKSSTKGKSGGFRICYFYNPVKENLFLLWIYPKNAQENLTADEKKLLKKLATFLKAKK